MWETAKALHYPLDPKISSLYDVPYTISFVIRKRMQVDSFMELPEEKRPDDEMIWDGTSEEIDAWLKKVFDNKVSKEIDLVFSDSDIER